MSIGEDLPDNFGMADVEARLLTEQPPGVLEAYHGASRSFADTIATVLEGFHYSEKEGIRSALHKIIAGTAILAYRIGTENGITGKVDKGDDT